MAPPSDSDSERDEVDGFAPEVGNINNNKQVLLDSSDDESSGGESSQGKAAKAKPGSILKVNRKYATEFEQRKRREELINARQAGDDEEDSHDSSSEEEDEDAELLTPGLDLKIIRTIKALRNKEDSIYDRNLRFFPERSSSEASDDDQNHDLCNRSRKPMRYKDVIRKQVLEQMDAEERGDGEKESSERVGGRIIDIAASHRLVGHALGVRVPNSTGINGQRGNGNAEILGSGEGGGQNDGEDPTPRLAYDEEQKELRAAFIKSTEGRFSDDEEGDDGNDAWMVKKTGEGGVDNSDDDAERLVKSEIEELENVGVGFPDISDPRGEIKNGDKFLLDFIKNKRWVDNSAEADNDESDEDYAKNVLARENNTEDDENNSDASLDDLEETDAFESKYNFRFEEAAAAAADRDGGEGPASGGACSVVGYARNSTSDTIRRKDDSRRLKRLTRKEKKAAERKAKEERLRRLKNAKRDEMENRLKQVRQVIGAAEGDGAEIDEAALMKLMEGDYDPKSFEKIMAKTYGDDFYEKEETQWKSDHDVKESLQDDETGIGSEIIFSDIYDDSNQEDMEDEGHEEDFDGGNDKNTTGDEMSGDQVEERGCNIEKKLKAKMMDELYKLDYEDIIDDLPTRFKYRKVESNSYGLSAQEILFARDTTLKQFVSLKKMAPYREGEEYRPGTKKRKRFRELLKFEHEKELKEGIEAEGTTLLEKTEHDQDGKKKKKRRRQKKGKKKNTNKEDVDASESNVGEVHRESADKDTEVPGDGPNKEHGETTQKRKKKGKKKGADMDKNVESKKEDSTPSAAADVTKVVENGKSAKKRKKKNCDGKVSATRKKKITVAGVPDSRLTSYGL